MEGDVYTLPRFRPIGAPEEGVMHVYGKAQLMAAIGAVDRWAPIKIVLHREVGETVFNFSYKMAPWHVDRRIAAIQRSIKRLPAEIFK